METEIRNCLESRGFTVRAISLHRPNWYTVDVGPEHSDSAMNVLRLDCPQYYTTVTRDNRYVSVMLHR